MVQSWSALIVVCKLRERSSEKFPNEAITANSPTKVSPENCEEGQCLKPGQKPQCKISFHILLNQ